MSFWVLMRWTRTYMLAHFIATTKLIIMKSSELEKKNRKKEKLMDKINHFFPSNLSPKYYKFYIFKPHPLPKVHRCNWKAVTWLRSFDPDDQQMGGSYWVQRVANYKQGHQLNFSLCGHWTPSVEISQIVGQNVGEQVVFLHKFLHSEFCWPQISQITPKRIRKNCIS